MGNTLRNILYIAVIIFIIINIIITVPLFDLPATTMTPTNMPTHTSMATVANPPTSLLPTPTATSVPTPIRIGVAIAITGGDSYVGNEQKAVTSYAEQYFKKAYGIPIELEIKDTTDNTKTITNTFDSLANEDVVAIVGPTFSNQAKALQTWLNEHKEITVIAPSTTAKDIPKLSPSLFRVSAPVDQFIPELVSTIGRTNPDMERFAVIYSNDEAFTISETKVFTNYITDEGYSLVSIKPFQEQDRQDHKDEAITNGINEILSQNPDAIFISTLSSDGLDIIRLLHEKHSDYNGLIITGDGLNSYYAMSRCGLPCNGIIMAQTYNPELKNITNDEFQAECEQYEVCKSQFSVQMFTAIQIIVEVLQPIIHNTLSAEFPTRLQEGLMSGSFETALGRISFDEFGEVKADRRAFNIIQVEIEEGETSDRVTVEFIPYE